MEHIEDWLTEEDEDDPPEEDKDDEYLYDCGDEIAAAQLREWLAYQDYCEGKQG